MKETKYYVLNDRSEGTYMDTDFIECIDLEEAVQKAYYYWEHLTSDEKKSRTYLGVVKSDEYDEESNSPTYYDEVLDLTKPQKCMVKYAEIEKVIEWDRSEGSLSTEQNQDYICSTLDIAPNVDVIIEIYENSDDDYFKNPVEVVSFNSSEYVW